MSTISDLENAYEVNKTKEVKLFNPDKDDFTVNYHGVPYTIHSQEIEGFPYYVAQHIKKHLAQHLMAKEAIKIPSAVDWERINSKIEVKYE